jgi:thiamine-phosphate pyrophosphorylase
MEHSIPPVAQRISGLLAVLDLGAESAARARPLAEAVIAGGAAAIELRMRGASDRVLVETAVALGAVCSQRATFLVHARLDVALASGADGVHFARDGFPIREAHNVIQRPGFLLAVDASTDDEARAAMQGGASFICFGPIHPADDGRTPVGLHALREICRWINVPIVAAGGIMIEHVPAVAALAPAAISLDRAITEAADPTAVARRIVDECRRHSGLRAQRAWNQRST